MKLTDPRSNRRTPPLYRTMRTRLNTAPAWKFPSQGRFTFDEASYATTRWCDSYQRLTAVLYLRRRMFSADWWRLLGEQWTGFDNVWEYQDRIKAALLRATPANLLQAMNEAERQSLRGQPDAIVVYRTCSNVNRNGLCWSLSREVAIDHATRNRYLILGTDRLLLTGLAPRGRSILKLDREEQEIISPSVVIKEEF